MQAVLETQAYLKRLGILFLGSFAFLGGPIAYQTFDPLKQVRLTIGLVSCAVSVLCLVFLQPLVLLQPLAHSYLMQTAEFFLSGAVGAGFVVSLAVLRIYLGWSYVGDRLLSAAVAYEETGWWVGGTNTSFLGSASIVKWLAVTSSEAVALWQV